jgi:hypothetical protein
MNKTQDFIDRAFSGRLDEGVKCPCSRCRHALCEDKRTLTIHLSMFGFMSGYDVWTHHGETIHQRTTYVVEDEDDRSGDDRMDEMLDAIRSRSWSQTGGCPHRLHEPTEPLPVNRIP